MSRFTCALYGATTRTSARPSARRTPSWSVHVLPTNEVTSRCTASASSSEDVRLPWCSTGTQRSPEPPSTGPSSIDWRAQSGRACNRPS